MIRKFVFSRNQLAEKKELAKQSDAFYSPGSVVVNGMKKPFTEMLPENRDSRFEDAQVVIVADTNTVKYTQEAYS